MKMTTRLVIAQKAGGEARVHPAEITDWRWVPIEEVTRELEDASSEYTPWFKMEWKELMDQGRNHIDTR
jgi:isopentenyl-diphosphate delta-isomerase